MEETLSKKDQDIESLRNTLKAKEEESCKLMKELNERCQLLQQEKGNCSCTLFHMGDHSHILKHLKKL